MHRLQKGFSPAAGRIAPARLKSGYFFSILLEGKTGHRAAQALRRKRDSGVPVVQLEFDVCDRIASLLVNHAKRLSAWEAVSQIANCEARHAAVVGEADAFRAVAPVVHDALPEVLLHSTDVISPIRDMLRVAWLVESDHFGRT